MITIERLEDFEECKELLKTLNYVCYDNHCCSCSNDLEVLVQLSKIGFMPHAYQDNGHGGYEVILKNKIVK